MNTSTKEWAKLFLEKWNRAVKLWDKGHLFGDVWSLKPYIQEQIREQREYANICCTWLIPNGFVEPHCVAEGR